MPPCRSIIFLAIDSPNPKVGEIEYEDADGNEIEVTDGDYAILIKNAEITVNSTDDAIHTDSGVIVTGGTLFVTSTLGMVETPSNNSTQYVVSYANSSSFSAGTVITVKDGSNNTVIYVTLKKTCQSIIFSSPNLLKGSTCTIYANNSQVTSFTVSSIITTIGSSYGGMGGDNMGGPGGAPGGMGGKGGFGR